MSNEEPIISNEVPSAQQEQAILIIASRLLSYPPDALDELVHDIEVCIEEEMESDLAKHDLKAACAPLFSFSSKDLKELYVSTFDLKSKLGLYLTAHEFGDSPKRGAALIKLQKTINQAGYEREEGELADYIPMLFELLAVAPESAEHIRLYKRLAIAIHRMLNNIDDNNPYTGLLRVLTTHVFPKPTKQEVADLENNREEADLEDLPFPIMYQ
ncbi:nitrate reductase molybdenum cofactor assembly chaperone [Virgibacillus sp. W0181]|uniref:nitrate reductase molybdenum cofactor assembly chaperone n=1 Tax=Virgibacillus sp. W0181 TaxID=3391581 RepID=UPI003F476647